MYLNKEVVTGLQVAGGKKGHFKMIHDVKRSTLSDANRRRPEAFFGELFHELYRLHYGYPDSRKINPKAPYEKRLFIIDSTPLDYSTTFYSELAKYPQTGREKED